MASHADLPEDMCSHQHVASDSDSEVYCDSVDQFGMEEVREAKNSYFYYISCNVFQVFCWQMAISMSGAVHMEHHFAQL